MHNWEVWKVPNIVFCFFTSILLQDGPASPVKMAKKDPVKKPVPVITESEEVDSFKFFCFFSVWDYPKILVCQKNICFLISYMKF